MKSSKYARETGRRLFRLCLKDGLLDESRVRAVGEKLTREKPRDFKGILKSFVRLVRFDENKRQVCVQGAKELSSQEQEKIRQDLFQKHGEGLNVKFSINESLIGGLRIRVGDHVYDGSIKERLNQLEKTI